MKNRFLYLFLLTFLLVNFTAYAANEADKVNKIKKAERIIALSPHSVEMLFAMGAGDKIIATTEYADYPAAAKKIERIGGYQGILIERVLELNPDLIIVWQSGNKSEQSAQLKKLGFNLYFSNPTTLNSIATELVDLGELVGHQAQATQLAEQFTQHLTSVTKQFADKSPVKTFYQLWPAPLQTAAGNSWIQHMIKICQGDNIFNDAVNDYPKVSLENVVLRSPEVFIIPIANYQQVPDDINWQKWPELPAVKNDQLYYLNADLLHRASPRVLDGLDELCQSIDKARAFQ